MNARNLLFVSALAVSATAMSDVKFGGIFTDNMVLQRGKPIPVCGWAEPGEKVTVEYNGASATAVADARGRFVAELPALDVEKTGHELVATGQNRVSLSNVVVGDVWLVSGQSNAERTLGASIPNVEAVREAAKGYPNIRSIKFNHETAFFPEKERPCNRGPWMIATAKTLKDISAEGYFMARELNAKTGIPIGILDNNWSGCRIEPYICTEGIEKGMFKFVSAEGILAARSALVDWCGKIVAHREDGRFNDAGPMPSQLKWSQQYNAMIAPITSFPICGATWYQGCSNCEEGMSYARKLKALINGWRINWGYDFPFYIVQLAAYGEKTVDPEGGNGFARIRNAQRVAAQTIPNCGLAVAVDIGNAKNIHPINKYDVGYRLSLWARRDVYGEKDLVVSGPIFKEMKIEGGKVRISFDHVGSGLFAGEKDPDTPGVMPTATPDGKLRGFAVAGEDKKWFWGEAVIDGNDVVIGCKDVPIPVAVRYAHRSNPMGGCNLYNKEGLPASPFRTDTW